jgi:uncharacterized membrane protein YeiB
VAPDLARGAMLALIAVANVHLYLVVRPIGVRGYPTGLDTLDRVVVVVQMTLVDGRAYPLFAALVGFGLARLATRQPESVLRRRALVLIGIGALHGILLFPGDIIGAYGLVAFLIAPALARDGAGPASSRTLLAVAGVITVMAVILGSFTGLPQQVPTEPSIALSTYVAALAAHPGAWLNTTLYSALLTAPGVLVGVVIARGGFLDDPAAHRRVLVRWTVGGLGAAVVLGLPLALAAASVWAPAGASASLAGAAHTAGGYAGALGFLGLFGLLATGRGPLRAMFAAAGTWSMTLYLAQSVVFCAVFAVWAGGWGARATLTEATLVGLATWLLGVLVAGRLALAGHRGPAELLVRRLTYARARA